MGLGSLKTGSGAAHPERPRGEGGALPDAGAGLRGVAREGLGDVGQLRLSAVFLLLFSRLSGDHAPLQVPPVPQQMKTWRQKPSMKYWKIFQNTKKIILTQLWKMKKLLLQSTYPM